MYVHTDVLHPHTPGPPAAFLRTCSHIQLIRKMEMQACTHMGTNSSTLGYTNTRTHTHIRRCSAADFGGIRYRNLPNKHWSKSLQRRPRLPCQAKQQGALRDSWGALTHTTHKQEPLWAHICSTHITVCVCTWCGSLISGLHSTVCWSVNTCASVISDIKLIRVYTQIHLCG